MNKMFKILIIFVLCVIIFLRATDNNIIIEKSTISSNELMIKEGFVNPLSQLSDGDNYTILLEISGKDRVELPKELPKVRCLRYTHNQIDSTLLKAWNFNETGGDMTTVGSVLYILKNDKLIFKSGIVITEAIIGLQHKNFGWLESASKMELIKKLSNFKPVYSPVIII